jgi:hypothetical protein
VAERGAQSRRRRLQGRNAGADAHCDAAAFGRTGFEPLHLSEYANEWIVKNRYEGTVEVLDDAGQPLPWPATNMVVVGQKPG